MKKLILTTLVGCIFILNSCSNQPNCSDSETKEIAFGLTKEIFLTEFAFQSFVEANPLHDWARGKDMNDPDVKNMFNKVMDLSMTNGQGVRSEIKEAINNTTSELKYYEKHIENAKKQFSSLNPEILNIRISNKEEELKKCTCEAELSLNNGNSVSLLYNVQINEEGETFVELQILE